MKRAMVLGAGGEVCFRRGVVRFLRFGSDCTGVTRAFIERSLLSAPHPALRATFPASRRRRRAAVQWALSGGQGRRSIAQRDPLAGPARAGRGRARAPGATGRRRRRNTLAQIPPSRAKPDQAGPRKWAWIFLDSFVRFEAFQWVTGNSNQKMQLPRWRPVGTSRPASIRPIAAMGASESLGDERIPHGPPWRDP